MPAPDMLGVCSHSEPPVLTAAATAVSIPTESSAPRVCVDSLLAKAGVAGKEVFPGVSNILSSQWRKEDRGLLLYFVLPSTVKEAWVLIPCIGLVFGHFGVRLTREQLRWFWWLGVAMFVGCNCVDQAGKPDGLPPCVMLSVVSPSVRIVSDVA